VKLDVSFCSLPEFPEPILAMTSLTSLHIRSHSFNVLPATITRLSNLVDFKIGKVMNIPEEITSQGAEAIKSYFEDLLAEGSAPSYQMKLMFVGKAAVGKVCA